MSTFGIIEIFIFLRLLRHNEKVYFERNGSALSAHKLTGRYQLSENIRTTKQLIPTLCLHVCINIIAGLPLGLAYFRIVTSQFGVVLCVSFILYLPITYLCFFIELSMILCHPFLRRDLSKIFKNFKCLFFNNSKSNKIAAEEEQRSKNEKPTLLKDIRGGQLIKSTGKLEADRHFLSIQAAWETNLPKNKI